MSEQITALDLQPADELSEATKAYFDKCREKLGLVPNVLLSYAFDEKKLRAFTDMYNDLMLGDSGLSKLEREMIAVAVSSVNHCYYCLTAHGAAVRQLSGDPALGEMIVMNYRAANLPPKQKAMLDFAVKLTGNAGKDRGRRQGRIAAGRFQRSRHLGHRFHRRLLQHVEPGRRGHRHAAQRRIPRHGAVNAFFHREGETRWLFPANAGNAARR